MNSKVCSECGKELNRFKTGLIYRSQGKRFCSIKCHCKYYDFGYVFLNWIRNQKLIRKKLEDKEK